MAILNPTKVVKIHGIPFTIKKLNPMHHMAGAQVLHKAYTLYGRPDKAADAIDKGMIDKVMTHYRDTFMSAVVSMRSSGIELLLSRNAEEPKPGFIPVDNLLTDWDLAEELYAAIAEFTYGKKKLQQFRSLAKSS